MSENFYDSFMADIYDYCNFWGSYRISSGHADKFYKKAFKDKKYNIVEFGTATGITSIPLARDGHTVLSIDLSEAMQARAAEKLKNEDESTQKRLKFKQGNVFDFTPEIPCSAIIIPDSLLLAMATFDNQVKLLKKSYDCLEDGGLLVLDVFQPLPELLYKENVTGESEFKLGDDTIHVYSKQNVNINTQLLHVHLEYAVNESPSRYIYDVYYKYIFRFELVAMLELAGFEIIDLSEDCFHYSVLAKKSSSSS